jgi:RNA polymerase sigma-70 factor (ECF subfamily)
MMTMPDDDVLVAQAQQGSCEAFGELIRRYDRRLYRLALHILRHREDAEDTVQNACLSAYQHIGGFRRECRFSTWLMKIAVNEALSRLRSRSHEQSATDTLDAWVDDVFEPRELPDWRLHPERQYARSELRALLRRSLEELPVAYSTVFLLRDVEGFSTAEVADALSLTISATKVRLLRARLKLRAKLEKHFESVASATGRPADEGSSAGGRPRPAGDAKRRKLDDVAAAIGIALPRPFAAASGD